MIHHKTITLAAVICSFLAAEHQASAGPGGTARPFRGTAVGEVQFTSPTTAIIDYTGTATHLGKFTRREYLTIDPNAGTVSGTMVYTAANGDELHLTFAGFFISATEAVGTYTFSGGTGRFADASGEATFYAYTPDGFVSVVATFDGELSY